MDSLEETTEQVVKRIIDVFNSQTLESFIGRKDDKSIFEMSDPDFSDWFYFKKKPYESLIKAYQGLSELRQVDTTKFPVLLKHVNKINEGAQGLVSYLEQELTALEDFKARREQYQQNLHASIVNMKNGYKFFSALDKKLHYTYETTMTPNISGRPIHGISHGYTPRKITSEEMQRILDLVEKENLVLRPLWRQFRPAFEVDELGKKNNPIPLLSFEEEQLPKGYNFDVLSKVFCSKRNLAMMKLAGLEKPREKSHYYY